MGILGSAVIPLWAARVADQRRIVWVLATIETVGLGGLFLQGGTLAALWVSLLGFVLGGTFGLALLLLVLRTADAETAIELSGMAQSVGYLVAATGPALFGLLHDLAQGWTVPLVFLGGILGAKVMIGLRAARPGLIGRDA